MPDSHKNGLITPEIYDSYHTVLYPNIMKQVNEYILPTAKAEGKLHLGLGFYLKTDNPERDVRTLNNSLNQVWSILTAIAISELHHRIDTQLASPELVQVTSTIYDSIYGIVKSDPSLIKWLNDNLVEILTKDFIHDQAVPNEANLDIGTNWANMQTLPNDVQLDTISAVMASFSA
jgi:hypothetical protein